MVEDEDEEEKGLIYQGSWNNKEWPTHEETAILLVLTAKAQPQVGHSHTSERKRIRSDRSQEGRRECLCACVNNESWRIMIWWGCGVVCKLISSLFPEIPFCSQITGIAASEAIHHHHPLHKTKTGNKKRKN
ncbi:hypothetical protein MLD38_007702 [Melastoma candidum]|uniref:Uncharacterized protein n=1 Tax=Melastoma candidum TaxID=119954 RepID=A0ACB9RRF0_9MYRT|nr:hypothetical protein MLD38_007702 [Melastoma candidum]